MPAVGMPAVRTLAEELLAEVTFAALPDAVPMGVARPLVEQMGAAATPAERTGARWAPARRTRVPRMLSRRWSIVGLTAAHSAGVAALRISGQEQWAPALVAAGTITGILFLIDARRTASLARTASWSRPADVVVLLFVSAIVAFYSWKVGFVVTAALGLTYVLNTAWEEMWFRVLWPQALGFSAGSAFASTAMFTLMHVPLSAVGLLVLASFGTAFFLLRMAGVGLYALVLGHAAFNLAASSGVHPLILVIALVLVTAPVLLVSKSDYLHIRRTERAT